MPLGASNDKCNAMSGRRRSDRVSVLIGPLPCLGGHRPFVLQKLEDSRCLTRLARIRPKRLEKY